MGGIMQKFEWVTKQYQFKGEFGDWTVLEAMINDLQKEFKQDLKIKDWGFSNNVDYTIIYNENADVILTVYYNGPTFVGGPNTISYVEINEEVVNKNIYSLPCPLCDGEMEYEPIDNPKGSSTYNDKTASHVYICDSCPGVLMEWHDHEDDKAVSNRLNGKA